MGNIKGCSKGVRITTTQQSHPTRSAKGMCHVSRFNNRPVLRQGIEIRRRDILRAIEPHIGIAQIIAKDQHNVRTRRFRCQKNGAIHHQQTDRKEIHKGTFPNTACRQKSNDISPLSTLVTPNVTTLSVPQSHPCFPQSDFSQRPSSSPGSTKGSPAACPPAC